MPMMFRRVDHVGVVVKDIGEARRWLGEIFGLPQRRSLAFPDRQVRAEFYGCGTVDVEVIELGDPEARRLRLGEGVQARIDHIAVEVEDLHATLTALAALGVRTTLPEPRRTNDGLSAWTVAETTGGISYQLIEKQS
jgi:methylmalonyl-CoA/ethylmalonyl-CoA epimerase